MTDFNRRMFLQSLGVAVGSGVTVATNAPQISRIERCCRLRSTAAAFYKSLQEQAHPVNGDERLFPNGEANFSKALAHNSKGEPLPEYSKRLIQAIESGSFSDLESVLLGGSTKLSDPLAQNAFALEGPDSHQLGIVAPPAFSSDEQAGELVELYWQALTRDIPFSEWTRNEVIAGAAGDLTALKDFRGPKIAGEVTQQTLFRIAAPGVLDGPYISQFLTMAVPYGDTPMEQRYLVGTLGRNFGLHYKQWLPMQNGLMPMEELEFESTPRYLATQRGLSTIAHHDFPFPFFIGAARILTRFGLPALSDTNPYKDSRTQAGFVTFGEPQVVDCMARAASASLKAAWFQKWLVHRRIRPEEFAFRVSENLARRAYPISEDLASSKVVKGIGSSTGGLLLPLAYPEGCPIHPSYPASYAVTAGACITILKAFFNEEFEIPNSAISDAEGMALGAYDGTLKVGGELNKLASNMAMARNAAGMHWRSDSVEGIRLGETVALGILRDMAGTGTEPFRGFRLTTFDGKKITVGG